MKYVHRLQAQRLQALLKTFPAVLVVGPRQCGKSTLAQHVDVLEGAYMVRRLQPYHANLQKRLTKTPKIYIRDTGLLHFLAGLRQPRELATWSRRGASFEGLVIEELAGLATSRLLRPELYFWRTQTGSEVDLLIGEGKHLLPVEIKAGAAVERNSVTGLMQCMKDLGLKRGWVVTTGRERRLLSPGLEIIPWSVLASGEVELF